jgi:hypothetical protein
MTGQKISGTSLTSTTFTFETISHGNIWLAPEELSKKKFVAGAWSHVFGAAPEMWHVWSLSRIEPLWYSATETAAGNLNDFLSNFKATPFSERQNGLITAGTIPNMASDKLAEKGNDSVTQSPCTFLGDNQRYAVNNYLERLVQPNAAKATFSTICDLVTNFLAAFEEHPKEPTNDQWYKRYEDIPYRARILIDVRAYGQDAPLVEFITTGRSYYMRIGRRWISFSEKSDMHTCYMELLHSLRGNEIEIQISPSQAGEPQYAGFWDTDWKRLENGMNGTIYGEVYQHIIDTVINIVENKQNFIPHIMDIGAGDGELVRQLFFALDESVRVEAQYLLVEQSVERLELAREALTFIPSKQFLLHDVRLLATLARERGIAPDIITASGVLNRQVVSLSDAKAIAREAYIILRPGGFMIIGGRTMCLLGSDYYSRLGFHVVNSTIPQNIIENKTPKQLYILYKPYFSSSPHIFVDDSISGLNAEDDELVQNQLVPLLPFTGSIGFYQALYDPQSYIAENAGNDTLFVKLLDKLALAMQRNGIMGAQPRDRHHTLNCHMVRLGIAVASAIDWAATVLPKFEFFTDLYIKGLYYAIAAENGINTQSIENIQAIELTIQHGLQVRLVAQYFSTCLGMSEENLRAISLIAMLHDIGKVANKEIFEATVASGILTENQRHLAMTHGLETLRALHKEGIFFGSLEHAIQFHHSPTEAVRCPYMHRLPIISDITEIIVFSNAVVEHARKQSEKSGYDLGSQMRSSLCFIASRNKHWMSERLLELTNTIFQRRNSYDRTKDIWNYIGLSHFHSGSCLPCKSMACH